MDKEGSISTISATLIFLVFFVLKVAGIGVVANWSWWWIFSPFWIPLALGLIILIVWLIIRK